MHTTNFETRTRDNENIDLTLTGLEQFLTKHKAKWLGWEIDYYTAYANIKWEFYIEMRSWGVKSFGVYATDVALEVNIDYYVGKSDDAETDEIEFDLTKEIKDFEINTQNFPINSYESKDSFSVESVDIDFTDKTITVYF